MTKDEALDLALEALEKSVATCFDRYAHEQVMSKPEHFINQAITAIKQARSAPVLDSTCNETLRAQGKAYPRTCRKCGLGPCIGAPKQPPAAQPTTEESSAVKPAAPVQEPVFTYDQVKAHIQAALMSAAQRQWVGLTDEERNKLWRDVVKWGDPSHDDVDLMKAIEAKLKEKNT
jgi:hypothetical protein